MGLKKTRVSDFSGTEGASTMTIHWNGRVYSLDLRPAELEYVSLQYALRIAQETGTRRQRREQTAQIRAWGLANGFELCDVGPIPKNVQEAYTDWLLAQVPEKGEN